jgi:hypothetical protein
MRDEIKKEENINIITHDIIRPLVTRVIEQLYGYFIGFGLIVIFIVISILIILLLNLKICYFK